jgi:pyruvate formate lyase activating enzyme
MTQGTIFKIKRYALHDGPGIRTTVFLKGCPLSCRWCHNPEGIDPRPVSMAKNNPEGEIRETVGEVTEAAELVATIEKDQLFYDESGGGVTFSGGEPLAQPQFLEAVLDACNRRDIHAALDTSGFAPAAVLDRVLPRLQLVLFDLKIMDADLHRKYTGVSNETILENLKRIDGGSTPWRLRIPLIPAMTDTETNLEQIARFASGLKSIQGVDLLPFHRIASGKYRRLGLADPMAGAEPPFPDHVAVIKNRFESAGFDVSIGG